MSPITDDYRQGYSHEIHGGAGIKILYRLDRDLTEDEREAFYQANKLIMDTIERENIRLDPNTHVNADTEKAQIRILFGGQLIHMKPIPNEYSSRPYNAYRPWYIVSTSIGPIKIGWRKSVLHIEWTESDQTLTAKEIFPNEEAWPGYETTQYDKIIHAHGYEAARNYIHRIINTKEPVVK